MATGRMKSTLASLVEVLKRGYHPDRVILFGSYAYGRPTQESDLDLLIVKRTSKPFYQRLSDVRRVVSDTRRGIPFEPVVVTPQELRQRLANGDQFFQEIVRRGRVLYAR